MQNQNRYYDVIDHTVSKAVVDDVFQDVTIKEGATFGRVLLSSKIK